MLFHWKTLACLILSGIYNKQIYIKSLQVLIHQLDQNIADYLLCNYHEYGTLHMYNVFVVFCFNNNKLLRGK